jgi:hypothetical protein
VRLGEDGRGEGHEKIGGPHGVDDYICGTVRISRRLALAGRGPWRGSCETSNAKQDGREDLANRELARQPCGVGVDAGDVQDTRAGGEVAVVLGEEWFI